VFSELVVAYLFLGGAGAGACAVLAILGLLADGDDVRRCATLRFRDGRGRFYGGFFGGTLVGAAAVLGLAALCLAADVGRPDRLLVLATSALTSYLVVGAWAVALCFVLALGAALLWYGIVPVSLVGLRVVDGLLLVVAIVVMAYTGLLLSDMASVPLWHSGWLPIVFVLSSLSCGIALCVVFALLGRSAVAFARALRFLLRVDGLLIVLECVALAAWLLSVCVAANSLSPSGVLTSTGQAARDSVAQLLSGSDAPLFWLGLVALGLVVPLVIDAVVGFAARSHSSSSASNGERRVSAPLRTKGALLASAGCVLVGGACLRAAVVAAGMLPAVVSPF
jgi:polysulfide reductase chain C